MADASSTNEDRIASLRLIRTGTIGPVTYWHLLRRFGSAVAALDAVPTLAARGGGRVPAIFSRDAALREMERVSASGARYLFRGDPRYPRLLAEVESAPAVLIAQGDLALLERPAIAMVGARNASAAGCRFARQLAQGIGAAGAVVVSGLARGVDTAAHDGSLDTGTIAVVAGGLDIFYPPENEQRQRAIGARGLLLSEQPLGLEPRARHFPSRNRIIAGIASGTVVVEAAPKSGSLITARQAAEFGREVMAIPGSPLDPRSQGCNQLIREGATLVQCAADVMEALRPWDLQPVAENGRPYRSESQPDISAGDREMVLALLGPTPVGIDEIVRQSGLPPAFVQTALLELELAGRLERQAGGRVSLFL